MKKNKLIDGIIKEPCGVSHSDHQATFKKVKTEIKKHIKALSALDSKVLINERIEKFTSMGVVSN
jgi:acetyl-CoA carboxylase carboxyl transferase subunit alpha